MNPGGTCENRALGLSDLEMCPKGALAVFWQLRAEGVCLI